MNTAVLMLVALAGASVEAEDGLPQVGYKKGFFIHSSDRSYRLHIGARLQGRYTLSVDTDDFGRAVETHFSIPRARIKLSGNAFSEDLKYVFQIDFGKGGASLKDLFVDYGFWPNQLHLRVGQFKRPFSRQQINSSGKLEFVDRAITDKAFGAGRDLGLMVHNNYTKSPQFEWAFGLFNGSGEKGRFQGDVTVDTTTGEGEVEGGEFSNIPDRWEPMLVGRAGYNYGKLKGYSEGDLEGGAPRFGIAASAAASFDQDNDQDAFFMAEVDYVVKVGGFSSTGGFYFDFEQPETDGDFSDLSYAGLGYHLQVSYLLTDMLQVLARFAMDVPEEENNNVQAATIGFNALFEGHKLKWQTDITVLTHQDVGDDPSEFRFRTQLRLAF